MCHSSKIFYPGSCFFQELIIQPVKYALDHYRRLNEASKKSSEELEVTDVIEEEEQPERPSSQLSQETTKKMIVKTESSHSLRSQASSRVSFYHSNTVDHGDGDLDEVDLTETEVDVSERTSRFKIATDVLKSPSRRNSSERRNSVGGRSSCERTISPKTLEDRLLPHVETGTEQEDEDIFTEKYEKESSLFSRLRIFSERLSSSEREKSSNGSTPMAKGNTKSKQVSLPRMTKRIRSKSEPTTKSRSHRTFNLGRPRISFGTNTQKPQSEENRLNDSDKQTLKDKCRTSSSPEDILSSGDIKTSTSFEFLEPKKRQCMVLEAQPSPTLSEKCGLSSSNLFLKHKRFSLSLDMLPRKNGRTRRSAGLGTQTPENTPVSSEDDLLAANKSQLDGTRYNHSQSVLKSSDKLSLFYQSSPKNSKKKTEISRTSLFKSFSLRKKSPTKDERVKHKESEYQGTTELRL